MWERVVTVHNVQMKQSDDFYVHPGKLDSRTLQSVKPLSKGVRRTVGFYGAILEASVPGTPKWTLLRGQIVEVSRVLYGF